MKPSHILGLYRMDIRRIIAENNAANPRVFGSVLHGQDADGSDLDILVDPIRGKTGLFNLIRIKQQIETLTGVPTDVLTPMALHERFRQSVLDEAQPL